MNQSSSYIYDFAADNTNTVHDHELSFSSVFHLAIKLVMIKLVIPVAIDLSKQ